MVEMLVYIAVLVFMLAIILEVILSVTKADRTIKTVRTIENSAIVSIEKLQREIRGAQSVATSTSIFDINPGKLVLNTLTATGSPKTVEFYLSGGKLRVKEDGVDIGPISEGLAQVTNLTFTRFATSTSEGIKGQITIESSTSTSYYRSEKFYFSTLLAENCLEPALLKTKLLFGRGRT